MRALANVANPNQCRPNPNANCLRDDPTRPLRIREMQGERNGDQRKRDRSHQSGRSPARLGEIEEPEERRHAPVKPRLPEGIASHQKDEMAAPKIKRQRAEREEQTHAEQPPAPVEPATDALQVAL